MNETNNITITLEIKEKVDFSTANIDILALFESKDKQKLVDFLTDNLQDKDGSPSIGKTAVSNYKFDQEKQEGSFRLNFDIERRFCCSDIAGCNQDYLDFNFTIEGSKINIKGTYFNWELNN